MTNINIKYNFFYVCYYVITHTLHTHKRGLSHTRVSVFLNKNSENDSLVFFHIKKSGEAFSMFRLYQKMIEIYSLREDENYKKYITKFQDIIQKFMAMLHFRSIKYRLDTVVCINIFY